ncbi:MAG: hypothetical protein NTU95_08560 [Methanothrix sp.]|nr:hypothetical protein [Methanothrix sp.]
MMYSKITQASRVVVAGILMVAVLGFCAGTSPASGADASKADYTETEIVALENVLASPENFTGTIGVTGKVISIDQSKSMFFMGCIGAISCACAEMPVKIFGEMPEIGSEVVVYGEITTTETGKYVFKGQEVKSQ